MNRCSHFEEIFLVTAVRFATNHSDVDVDGTLSKAGGSFKIDHPLDPANKCLYHSFVESPDLMNIYNGNVTTDAEGNAVVTLPDWFEVLNRDFRYQLTVIGQFAQAIVASKVANRQFSTWTDKPDVEVSWQVTGIRQDALGQRAPHSGGASEARTRARFLFASRAFCRAGGERHRVGPSPGDDEAGES